MFIFRKLFKDLLEHKDLIYYLTRSNLKANTARTYMGFLWWILDPILYMAVFYLLVQVILQRGGEHYAVFLFVALIPLKWTISCLVDSTTAISSKSSIIQQIYVPKIVFVTVRLMINTFKFCIGSVMLFLFLWVYGIPVTLYFNYYLPIAAVHALFLLGCMLILAHVGVYLKDIKNMMQYIARMLFYLSPVLYTIEDVLRRTGSETLVRFLYLNPLTSLIESYRNVLLLHQPPLWIYLAVISCISALLLYIGLKILYKYENQYAKVI